MISWALQLPVAEASRAAILRNRPGVELAIVEQAVWLRGTLANDDLSAVRVLIPGARAWLIGARNELFGVGQRVPEGILPVATWRPLAEWIRLEFPHPVRTIPRRLERVELRLRRSHEEREANLLLCAWPHWMNYADTAPQWRLERLAFAVRADRLVAIRGQPLPPLPGEHFVEREGVAIAAGWKCHPSLDVQLLREGLKLNPGDLLLARPATPTAPVGVSAEEVSLECERIGAEHWVRGTRCAVRATREMENHVGTE